MRIGLYYTSVAVRTLHLFNLIAITLRKAKLHCPAISCIGVPVIFSAHLVKLIIITTEYATYSPYRSPMMPHSESYMKIGTVIFISKDLCPEMPENRQVSL